MGESSQPWQKTISKIIVPEQKELYFLGKLPTLAKNNFKDYCVVPEQKELYLMGRLPTLEGTQLQKLKFRRKKKTCKKAGSTFIVPEKQEQYFWERPKRARPTASKIIVPQKEH